LGPPLNFKRDNISAQIMQQEFDFIKMASMFDRSIDIYKSTFDKFKDTAIDNNIDLFICYAMMNDACLDVAHALKKPVVGFMSFLSGNYI
jgi:hypothetical protein